MDSLTPILFKITIFIFKLFFLNIKEISLKKLIKTKLLNGNFHINHPLNLFIVNVYNLQFCCCFYFLNQKSQEGIIFYKYANLSLKKKCSVNFNIVLKVRG